MTSDKLKPARPTEKRLAEALRIANLRRDRLQRRRRLRVAVPTGHHEAELRVS